MLIILPFLLWHLVFLIFGLVDSENETAIRESKANKETIDFKEVKRVDHILASLQRKVSPNDRAYPCFLYDFAAIKVSVFVINC